MGKQYHLTKFRKIIITTFRIYLAIIFLIYGVVKMYPGQFATGDFVFDSTKDSAMSLAWHFFGYSAVYSTFIAAGEIIAAILLLIPRTATLGAIVLLPITMNISLIDFCFAIPALDISLLLSLMCLSLLLLERKKLMRVFFTGGETQ